MQITLLDGGTGQEIYRRSKLTEAPLWSVEAMLNEPEIVTQVHQDFIAAGSEVCTLNTYTATPTRLRDTKHKDDLKLIHDLATRSLEAAIKSSGQRVKIAGCLPPIHGSYLDRPARTFDSLLAEYSQLVQLSPSVDLWQIETMTNPVEASAAVNAAQATGKPVLLAYRLEKNGRLKSGQTLAQAREYFDHTKLHGILINCSEPEIITQHIAELAQFDIPFGAYGNGFVSVEPLAHGQSVSKLEAREDLSPVKYADHVEDWMSRGATIVGGCCEISPSHIQEIKNRLSKLN
jgi:S-methylmethionine-dependent homocysteine/selenocysteine methylase